MMDISSPQALKEFKEKYKSSSIYTTAYRYNQKQQDTATLHGDFYLDFDSDNNDEGFNKVKEDVFVAVSFLKAIFNISIDDMKLYFSGKKGIHLIIPHEILKAEPHINLNEIYKMIAKDINNLTTYKTIDLRIYDRVRLMRIPNSYHDETGLYKVIIKYEQLLKNTYIEIKHWARKKRLDLPKTYSFNSKAAQIYKEYIKQWEAQKQSRWKKDKTDSTLDFCPPCIKHLLDNGAKEGKRNNTIAVLASYFKQRGYEESEAFEMLCTWNKTKCLPSVKEFEVERTLKSIYRSEHYYGCQTLEEISVCYKDECPFGKRR